MITDNTCEHKFVHLRNENWKRPASRYSFDFVSIDYFYCEKCLEEKVIKKTHNCPDHKLSEIPDWCKLITTKITGYE